MSWGARGKKRRESQATHPRLCARRHTRQKGRLVRQVLDAEALETAHSEVAAHRPRPAPAALVLAHHLRIDSGQTESGDVGHDDKGTGEDDLVSGLGAFDDLGPQDHVESAGPRSAVSLRSVRSDARKSWTHDRGIEPVGISFGFSWIRTFCQSENLDCSMMSFQAVRLAQVVFGHIAGWRNRMWSGAGSSRGAWRGEAHLGVLELLFDVSHRSVTDETAESPERQFGPDLARPGHCAAECAQFADLVGSHIADALDERQVVECDAELADGEAGGGGGRSVRIEVEVLGRILLDEVRQRSSEIRQEAVERNSYVSAPKEPIPPR